MVKLKLNMDVKTIIKERGYTLEQVAALFPKPISTSAISQSINGNPTISTLQTIADIIGCKVSDFFRDEVDNNTTMVCPHCGKPIVVELKG